MRKILKHVAWALAAVALVIATPLQAAASRGHGTTPAPMSAATSAANASAFATATPRAPLQPTVPPTQQQQDTGQGWDELYCMACVGMGALALYSGGITMLPVILGNASMYGTLTGTCLLACESAIKSLLK